MVEIGIVEIIGMFYTNSYGSRWSRGKIRLVYDDNIWAIQKSKVVWVTIEDMDFTIKPKLDEIVVNKHPASIFIETGFEHMSLL